MEIQKISDNIYYLILIGTCGSLLLASSVIYFYIQYYKKSVAQQEELQKAALTHRKHLLQATIQSQENERVKISKDLHDHIGSSLSNLRYMVSHIQNAAPGLLAIQVIAEEYKSNIDRIIEDVRNISHSLSPAGLSLWGLKESLEEYCEQLSRSTGMKIQVSDYSQGILKHLTFDVSLALYRVMQELLSNTIKHASAKSVTIITSKENDCVAIHYTDDGNGIKGNIFGYHGIGIYNIESRLSTIEAQYEIVSSEGAGFSFKIKLARTSMNKKNLYD